MPNGIVICRKKIAISVKSWRQSRPRKGLIVHTRRVRISTRYFYLGGDFIKKNGKTVLCEYCGCETYKTEYQLNKNKHHFCSTKCQALMKRELTYEHRKCEICEKDMYIPKKSTQRFCSYSCQNKWQSGNTGYKNPKFLGGYLTCETCGLEFLVGKTIFDSKRHHFCSVECKRKWYSDIWSKTPEWRDISRKRAVDILNSKPVITQSKPQIVVNQMLDEMNIAFRNEEPFVYYSIDNYLPEYNLAIEVMGDYWHASPIKYTEVKNDRQRHVISRDKAKRTYLKNQNQVNILYLWENDILNNYNTCKMIIRHFINNNGEVSNYHSFNYSIIDGEFKLNDDIIIPHQERN